MNHVDEPFAFAGDFCLVFQVLQKEVAPARPVDARHTQDDGGKLASGRRSQKQFFRLHQYFAGFGGRFGRARLLHQRAVGLSVNAGAARVNKSLRRHRGQPFDQVAHPLEIDLAIFLHAPFGRGNTVHHPIERRR